ncbi:hypothetical protein NP233_g6732 [Leucocoprinus birnbaumii]|uniref:Cytochrome P450 n=1 Tax=Leucocoprinus birnbaumii TaxID=56174 RepID=A0AAD5VSU2_9AGAR|nr:hypothetical protein NP233_g6732 [Leucocoprinus birnbaumii]
MASILVQGLAGYVAVVLLWKYLKWLFVDSPLDIIPGPPSHSFITGNIRQLFDHHGWKFYYDTLDRYGAVTKMKGQFGKDMLFIYDPRALHYILVKDQQDFPKTTGSTAITKLMFGGGLLSVSGEQHRKQRKMLTPVFSIAHMRAMTPIFYEVTRRLHKALVNQVKNGPKEVDILHWMSRTALELIGKSGMDYSFDSLRNDHGSDEENPYARSVKRFGGLFANPAAFWLVNYVVPFTNRLNFPRTKRWIVDNLPSRWAQDVKDIADVMESTAKDICKAKQKDIDAGINDESKKDIINILMRANASASEVDQLTDAEVLAQVATLVFAAMDTTSSALSRTLSLLIQHQDAQEKLRAELLEATNNGADELEYDRLVSLPYLDAVCRETLRVHPPVATAGRVAGKDMVVPLFKPLRTTTGTQITEILIPKGTSLSLSLLGANTNPEIWGPDSYEWKPERWLNSLPEKVGEAHMPGVYSNLMTFLGGSRSCIGFKFSQLEMKVVLAVLISSFKFEDAGKNIMWKMTGISSPIVEGKDATRPALPVMLSLLGKEERRP